MLQSRIKDDVFSTGYFVEVVINAVGGRCFGSRMKRSETDKAGQREEKGWKDRNAVEGS